VGNEGETGRWEGTYRCTIPGLMLPGPVTGTWRQFSFGKIFYQEISSMNLVGWTREEIYFYENADE